MTTIDKNLLESYSNLFEGLSAFNKKELIERLSNSLKVKATKKVNFFDSFGGFDDKKSPEEIIKEIKLNRAFKNKEIEF